MRRVVVVLMLALAALFAIAGPASACRIAQESYGTPAVGQANVLSLCLTEDPPLDSCVFFDIQPGEDEVWVTITDATGLSVFGTIGQDYNDDGLNDAELNFCNSSPSFPVMSDVPIGRAEVVVFPQILPGIQHSGGACADALIATSGIVTAIFC